MSRGIGSKKNYEQIIYITIKNQRKIIETLTVPLLNLDPEVIIPYITIFELLGIRY
jgi:hypothetical protein